MAEVEVDAGGRWLSRRWVIISVVVLVLVGLGVLYVALAEVHSSELRIVRDDATGLVQVERGLYAPLGWTAHTPTEAFRPVRLEPDIPLAVGKCADVRDCEARLFEAVAEQARRLLRRREQLREASVLIAQAVKLSGESNVAQRLALEGDEQYVRGLLKLEESAAALLDAARHFRRSRAMGSKVFRDSHLRWRQSLELLDALRQSGVHVADVEPGELDPAPLDPNLAPPRRDLEPPAPSKPRVEPAPRTEPAPPDAGGGEGEGPKAPGEDGEDWSEL